MYNNNNINNNNDDDNNNKNNWLVKLVYSLSFPESSVFRPFSLEIFKNKKMKIGFYDLLYENYMMIENIRRR